MLPNFILFFCTPLPVVNTLVCSLERPTCVEVSYYVSYDNGSESAPKIGKDGMKRWDKKDGQTWAKMGKDIGKDRE